jgi:hypothetical protein
MKSRAMNCGLMRRGVAVGYFLLPHSNLGAFRVRVAAHQRGELIGRQPMLGQEPQHLRELVQR